MLSTYLPVFFEPKLEWYFGNTCANVEFPSTPDPENARVLSEPKQRLMWSCDPAVLFSVLLSERSYPAESAARPGRSPTGRGGGSGRGIGTGLDGSSIGAGRSGSRGGRGGSPGGGCGIGP